MSRNNIIAFPHIGNYNIPTKYLIEKLLKTDVVDIPFISSKTAEIGNKYSPNFICSPFKYTLGTLIEGLEMGANVLVQYGGGCRYGYYSELQQKILTDLGYDFKMINLIIAGRRSFTRIYKEVCKIKKVNIIKSIYYIFIAIKMVKYMDLLDDYMRKNSGFEVEKNSFKNVYNDFLNEFSRPKGFINLYFIYKKYMNLMKKIRINKPENPIRIMLIGELYTLMEPYSNFNIEKKLLDRKIEITRYTNAYFLLFKKKFYIRNAIRKSKYINNGMGADAANNICRTEYACKNNFDGIIHIKSTFCTPEIGAMPIINRICIENNMPVLFMSFDVMNSEVGIETRIEAFVDMLEMRHNND